MRGRASRLIAARDLATVLRFRPGNLGLHMPLNFGKIGAVIALITVAAFVLWLIATTFFASEQAEQELEQTGAVTLDGGAAG